MLPNPDILYRSDKHEDALACLEYGLAENSGMILLTGEIGTGKTTLIRHLINTIDPNVQVAEIVHSRLNPEELIHHVLIEFELESEGQSRVTVLDRLNGFLVDSYQKKRRVLLIVDEAQNLPVESLEEIRMLSNLQTDDQFLMQIILVGQPQLKAKLMEPELAQINQRIAVSYHLKPLNRNEATAYIRFRLKKAGGQVGLFTEDAIKKAVQISRGIPRVINNVCDTAMAYAYGDGAKQIDRRIIKRVMRDRAGMGLAGRSSLPLNFFQQSAAWFSAKRVAALSIFTFIIVAAAFYLARENRTAASTVALTKTGKLEHTRVAVPSPAPARPLPNLTRKAKTSVSGLF